jgi:hypothetical protein
LWMAVLNGIDNLRHEKAIALAKLENQD